ncbi:nucleotide sugar dehydrogenase [Salinibacter ruber]|nr:nucleotide sugar dehydrogenase [Salinibacter ruber]
MNQKFQTQSESPSSIMDGADPFQKLQQKIQQQTATIGVVGLGYVGLPLAVEYAKAGFETRGIDLDSERVRRLDQGENYNDDLDDETVERVVGEGFLSADEGFGHAGNVDVFFICVPTPVTEHNEPDTSYIESATRSIGEHLRPGQLVVLKSTTYPGTTEEVVQDVLGKTQEGLQVGHDYFVAFSPERIDPGNEEYTTANTPVVAGGVTSRCTTLAEQAIGQVVQEVHTVSNPKVAEMEKLLENIYRSVNIALVNELAQLSERMDDVSIWEVIEAASTKPFGFDPFYPGPGLGGHCIPVDPHYLSWTAQRHDFETSFITLSARVNEDMPFHVCQSVTEAIAQQPVALSDATVLILGVAFKANVDDTRHSPAGTIIRLLQEKGVGTIRYHDPHVESYSVPGSNGEAIDVPSVALTPEALHGCDVAVITTGHDAFDAEMIAEHAPQIVDTRNALADVEERHREKIQLLGHE